MMATLTKIHVKMPAENAVGASEPQLVDTDDLHDSCGGSNDKSSDDEVSDGGENDTDGDGGTDGEEAGDGDAENDNTNAGWAEAMAKILEKKIPVSESSILAKNKELNKQKEKEKLEQLERKKQVDKKRTWEMICREKPDIVKSREIERALQRTATRGVVQLFNAVRKHQKTINDKVKEVGASERKKAKVLSSVSKKDFVDVLRTEGSSGTPIKSEGNTAVAAEEKPAWSVLRDDFMMGASMKDWDRDSD